MLPPQLLARAAAQHGVVTAADCLACGIDHQELAALRRAGHLVRLARGVYATGAAQGVDPARCLHASALLAHASRDPLLAGRSAAEAWGLPLVGERPARVELVTDAGEVKAGPQAVVRVAALPAADRARASGLAATSLARTVLDVARTRPFVEGVVVADAALAQGLARGRLLLTAEAMGGWPGMRRAIRVAAFADARAESPLESLSRVRFAEHGLPAPDLQVRLEDDEGLIGFGDFGWPGVVGEADGKGKYDAPEALWAEKVREDRIRARGDRVVRWGWQEAWFHPERLCGRVGAALRWAA